MHAGLEDLASRLGPEERGALIVVTHGPLVDTFLEILDGNVRVKSSETKDMRGKAIYEVSLKKEVQAHLEGQYATGVALQDANGNYNIKIGDTKITEDQLDNAANTARSHAKFYVQQVHTL